MRGWTLNGDWTPRKQKTAKQAIRNLSDCCLVAAMLDGNIQVRATYTWRWSDLIGKRWQLWTLTNQKGEVVREGATQQIKDWAWRIYDADPCIRHHFNR